MAPRDVTCICGAVFVTRHSGGKYCSPACARIGERKSWREYGKRNRDGRSAYHKDHYQKNADAIGARVKAYRATPSGKRAQRVHDMRSRQKYPERVAARQAVAVAMRTGRLGRQDCEVCDHPKTHAHHDDYSKPLDVRWLCEKHHRAEHRRINARIETP